MLYLLKRFEAALDTLKLARSLDPRDPTPELYRAIILRDLYRPTEAVDALNHAITLNDDRAVYRSRFLLDRDLAVKNVSLAIVYNQLGLSAWAANKAIASIKEDFTNYAGHLFLSGAWSDFPRAMGSELLLARMLQPANFNTFNGLNEYTPFFEQPGINGVLSGSVGNYQSYGGSLSVNGAIPSANVAVNLGAFSNRTDGWRETNYGRQDYLIGNAKWDATPKDGFMAMASQLNSRQGYTTYAWDSQPDPYISSKPYLTRWEAGYHHHFAPNADLLLFVTRVNNNGTIWSHSLLGPYPFPPFPPYYFEGFQIADYKAPYYEAQAQYQFKLKDHQFILGSAQYWGDNDIDSQASYFLNWGGALFPLSATRASNNPPKRFQTYYVQDIWKAAPMVTLEAAAYYDQITASDALVDTQWSFSRFDPRFGLIVTPTKADTIRLAAFQYILPFDANRLDPMDVAGVPIFRNAVEGSVAKEADLTWEHEWPTGYVSANLFYVDRQFSFKTMQNNVTTAISQSGYMKGSTLALNQLIFRGLGLSAGYSYVDVSDENFPSADRRDNIVSVGLRYVHPSGISAFAAQTYRHSHLLADGRSDEHIWLTDAGVAYQFPGKRGSISVAAYNIFNNHFNWVTDFFTFSGRVPARQMSATLSLFF